MRGVQLTVTRRTPETRSIGSGRVRGAIVREERAQKFGRAPPRCSAPLGGALALLALVGTAAPPAVRAQQIEQGVAIVAEKIASRVGGYAYHANSSSELDVRGTTLAQRLVGSARVRTVGARTEIAVKIDHAPDAATLGPFAVYVLWVITPEGRAANIGTFEMDGERGRIETTTPLSSFALIVTAEPHFAVSVPCQHVVAQTVGTNVKGTALEVTSLASRIDYPGLKRAVRDAKHPVPLDLEMARYALAIADLVGAPELAAGTYARVLGKYTRNTDTKLLMSAFKSYILGYIRNIPTVTLPEMEAVMEDIAERNPKAKGVDARKFYDPAPLEQLVKEGFVKELYPR